MSAGVSAASCPAGGFAGTACPYALGIRNAETSVTRISTDFKSFPCTILDLVCISFIVIGTSYSTLREPANLLLRRLTLLLLLIKCECLRSIPLYQLHLQLLRLNGCRRWWRWWWRRWGCHDDASDARRRRCRRGRWDRHCCNATNV